MITKTSIKLTSLAQDDTELNMVEVSGDEILTGGVNSQGERKKIYVTFSVEDNDVDAEQLELAGSKLWVSWALFFPSNGVYSGPTGPPQVGFSLNIPASQYEAGDGALEMIFYGPDNFHPGPSKNLRCFFYFLTDTTFALELEYYITYDEDAYLNADTKSNLWRFLCERYSLNTTAEIPESAYGESKDLRLYTYFEQEDVPEPETFEGPITEGQEHILWQGQLSRFDSVMTLLNADGDELGELNTVIDTEVNCRIYTTENTIDKFYARLIRIQEDPNLNFFDNYELQENFIDAANAEYNVFKGPFGVTRNDIDGYYGLTFDIDKDYLVDGARYRIMILAYHLEDEINAFNRSGIGNELPTTNIVPYCENPCPADYENPNTLDLTASLFDIDNEYTGNFLTCCIEERMRTQLIVDYSDDRWKNNIDCRRYGTSGGDTTTSNDIRKYLKGVGLEIYNEYTDPDLLGTVKNILDDRGVIRTGTNTYTSNGIYFSFDTTNEILTLKYDFRNRNQSNFPCLSSFLNGAPYLPLLGNQYWGGFTIYIKWRLTFYYHDFPTPFIDNIEIIQKMVVKDYSEDVTFERVSPGTIFCQDETLCYKAIIGLMDPETYELINTAELSDGFGGGSGDPDEAENFTPGVLDQETSDIFSSQDADYTGGDAEFCIDASDLDINQNYKFSAMAKKIQ